MNSSERRIKIIMLLQQSGKKLTVDELASEFGVSRRTIFRDFNALSEMNVPVTWDKYSGYGVMPGFKIPPLMFTSKELATILVGLNFVRAQVNQELVNDARGVELKIKEVLPTELQEFMTSLEGNTIVDPYLRFGGKKKSGEGWYLLSSAIAQKKRVQFHYTAKEGATGIRKIDPYILVFYHDHWNVIGKSHLRGETRNFLLENIKDVHILDENYVLKEKINPEALIFREDESSSLIDVMVEKSEIERFEANLPAKIFKKNEEKSKYFRVQFKFNNLDFINAWLLQFGNKIKTLGPEELKQKRTTLLLEMLNH